METITGSPCVEVRKLKLASTTPDMMKTSTYNVRVNIQPEEQQGNGVDFGLFATAFAVTWAFGNKRETISCDKGNLQHLLVDYLKLKKI